MTPTMNGVRINPLTALFARCFSGSLIRFRALLSLSLLAVTFLAHAQDTAPPTIPSGLTATTVADGQINVAWQPSTDDSGYVEYEVERCQGQNCSNFAFLLAPSVTNSPDFGVAPSTATVYRYRVRAKDGAGNFSGYSNVASAVGGIAPTAPTNVSAIGVTSTQINLSWTASTDQGGSLDQYELERCQGASCTDFVPVMFPPGSSTSNLDVVDLSPATTYRYRLRAKDAVGNFGDYSVPVIGTTLSSAPTAPTSLNAAAVGFTQINLSFTASTDHDGWVVEYEVERCEGAGCTNFVFHVGQSSPPIFDMWNVAPSSTYRYRIRAKDDLGYFSEYSNATSVTTSVDTQAGLFYIEVDHLNTPRLVANQAGQTMWRWEQWEPFGVNVPDENPSSLGTFEFPLRFSGQYFDRETNLHYNHFRDYDSITGRYVQSDPIGLKGGLNTYTYVGGNPISFSDPLGLDQYICYYAGGTGHIGHGVNSIATVGFYPQNKNIGALTGTDPGVVRSDAAQGQGSCKVIKTSPEVDKRIQNAIDFSRDFHGGYSLTGNNCVNFVRLLLQQGGISSPESFVPKTFFEQLEGAPVKR